MRLARVRQRGACHRGHQQPCESYRSHPLSTTDAIACRKIANVNTSAESALIAPMKPDVAVNGALFCARRVARQDTMAATEASSSPAREANAEYRACWRQSR